MNPLTVQEERVYKLVLQGMAVKEMATAMNLSVRTTRFHVENILRKSGAGSRIELVARNAAVSGPN
jgi:DNA-binding NarL/FixJ family response regulator